MNRQAALRLAFDAEVESWINAVLSSEACPFAELLSRLPGVHPCTALEAVQRMQEAGRLDASIARFLQRDAATPLSFAATYSSTLPPPHPLDFEWRFSQETAKKILSVAQSLAKPDDSVLLFGTPAVAYVATTGAINRAVHFVGEDNIVTRSVVALNKLTEKPLSVEVVTSRQPMPAGAGVVVVDPPWYFDFMRPMLAVAASACRVGGHVLISLLGTGTRPGAECDRERLIAYLRRLALYPVETLAGALTYEMPFFESNALAAAGIRGAPRHWRRSDLVVLRKLRDGGGPLTLLPRQKAWHDITVGRMRLFIARSTPTVLLGDRLQPIVPGDILPTVSRRDPRRRKAQVWTSGNRIFRSTRTDLVLAAAQKAANSHFAAVHPDIFPEADRDEVKRLSYVLSNLATREDAEERGTLEDAPCLAGFSTSGLTQSSAMSPTTASG
jgi:hypothetical protein